MGFCALWDGKTPVHWAAEWNKADCLELLIANKADLDKKDDVSISRSINALPVRVKCYTPSTPRFIFADFV